MRQLLLLRPEPGLSASAERARRMGLDAITCPLFQVEALSWKVPDHAGYDALLLTSANAIRYGGSGLDKLKKLPVHAVGRATAQAAREAGFEIASTGSGSVEELLAALPEKLNLLHLAGEDYRDTSRDRLDRCIVYRSAAIQDPPLPALEELVVAVHSARAGLRLAELADSRAGTAIAAISEVAAKASGTGWERIGIAERPSDPSLLALAAMLCHTTPQP